MVFTTSLILVAAGALAGTVQVTDVAPVWAGHPVGFCLLTHAPNQYVAYYDAERRMTVASRILDSDKWTFTVLPEQVGWDSHNSIVMAADDAGNLHLSGNMHVAPLVYFQTARPWNATTFERLTQMIGQEETHVTYPKFFRGPDDELMFTYRDGRSGSGNQIYNRYDAVSRTWSRLLDEPLVDGEGLRNAYLDGPRRGPDGYFHLCWVWRETPDCATNHDPSYARSRDLVHWERSDGTPLRLPITYETAEVIDRVPEEGGVINGNVRLGFDLEQRPVVTYHKYDAAGNTQVYLARRESSGWVTHCMTEWAYRWDFSGGGSIGFEVSVSPIAMEDGALVLQWLRAGLGSERWRLEPDSLRPLGRLPNPAPLLPAELRKVFSAFPGILVKTSNDAGDSGEPGVRYLLRWETLGPNRDRPREKPWPEPSMLQVVRVELGGE